MRIIFTLCMLIMMPVASRLQDVLPQTREKEAGSKAPAAYFVQTIRISGNSKTKESSILRELPFREGEKYPAEVLVEKMAEGENLLMNTGLFRTVSVSLSDQSSGEALVDIRVEERWYIFPIPFLRSVDNSLLQWLTANERDISRLNYGVKLTHRNFTGRNDRLHLSYMNGFTRQGAIQYNNLFLDRNMKWSANLGMNYGSNRAVNYKTEENRHVPVATSSEDFVHSYFRTFIDVTYRKEIKTRHTFGIGFSREIVADTVIKLNPDYSQGSRKISSSDIFYMLQHTDVDFLPYPTKGYLAEASITKRGIGGPLNLWQLSAKTSGTWPAGKNYFNLRVAGILKLPFDQPYITQQFIGHNNMFLQGYEGYVIDGVAGGYMKATFARPVFDKKIRVPENKLSPLKKIGFVPLKIYAKAFVNTAYVHNQQPGNNSLSNKMLYSGGLGLDIIALTDMVIKLEWSFNLLGQNGLYLHPRNSF
jgi:outer membrane protein assembly factor BamA